MALGGFVFGLIMVLCMRRLVTMTHKAGRDQVINLRELVGHFADGLHSMKPIKAMALEERVAPLLQRRARDIEHAQRREVLSVALFQSLNEPLLALFLGGGLYVVFVVFTMPFAEVAFMAVVFQRLVTRVSTLQGSYQGLVGSQVTYLALSEATDGAVRAEEPLGGTTRLPSLREIRLQDVAFAHDKTPVLSNVSMRAMAGEITAIIGPSGAGKTTIVDLIIGFNRSDRGRVTVNGVSLDELDMAWWRSQIGYVPQETVMFNDTILRNVTLGDPALSRDDAMRALSAAGLEPFIASLSEGLDTNVGERGNRVSGGQRQRLAIARALARKPALLIFDEATTSLDPDTEAGILATLRALAGKITVVAISHQPALLDIADSVYRISDGVITAAEARPAVAPNERLASTAH
jgi:ATP-binding cassette subfamily C protein